MSGQTLDPTPGQMLAAAAPRRRAGAFSGAPVLALGVCAIAVIAAVFGQVFAPYTAAEADFFATFAPPVWLEGGTWAHVLGTDELGRDVLSRLIAGARISLTVAAAAVVLGGLIGVTLGVTAGYSGGLVDGLIMRIVDAFLAMPFILMALAFVSALGLGFGNIIIVMVLTSWARYARLVRSEVISIKQRDYVTLARIAGVSPVRIALRHILPNAMHSIVALALLDIGRAIILEASLSFLGLGIQPPDVSWGLMLAEGKGFIDYAWWLTALPGIAIVLVVMSFNTVGDWVKLRLDPREAV